MATTTKYFRERYDLTQKELSELFDIPLATIKNWESRKCCPDYIITMMYMYKGTYDRMWEYRKCIKDNLSWGSEMFFVPEDLIS